MKPTEKEWNTPVFVFLGDVEFAIANKAPRSLNPTYTAKSDRYIVYTVSLACQVQLCHFARGANSWRELSTCSEHFLVDRCVAGWCLKTRDNLRHERHQWRTASPPIFTHHMTEGKDKAITNTRMISNSRTMRPLTVSAGQGRGPNPLTYHSNQWTLAAMNSAKNNAAPVPLLHRPRSGHHHHKITPERSSSMAQRQHRQHPQRAESDSKYLSRLATV